MLVSCSPPLPSGAKSTTFVTSEVGENVIDQPGYRVPCSVSVSCVTCLACESMRVIFLLYWGVFRFCVLPLLLLLLSLQLPKRLSRRCPCKRCSKMQTFSNMQKIENLPPLPKPRKSETWKLKHGHMKRQSASMRFRVAALAPNLLTGWCYG